MDLIHHKIVLSSLILVVILSSVAIIGSTVAPSGLLSGPFPCTVSFDFEAPSSIDIYPGGSGEYIVTISNVMCGMSHVVVEMNNVPTDYYTIEPALAAAIAPLESMDFTISLDIPLGSDFKTYLGTYDIKTNQGWFTRGETEVNIKAPPAKPEIEVPIVTGPTKEVRVSAQQGISGWWIVGLLATILAILLIASEYFAETHKEEHVKLKTDSNEELGDVLNDYKTEKKKGKK